MRNYKQLLLPGFSLALVGLGLSLAIDAGCRKWASHPPEEWIFFGTVGLVCLNAGLSLFGKAILQKLEG